MFSNNIFRRFFATVSNAVYLLTSLLVFSGVLFWSGCKKDIAEPIPNVNSSQPAAMPKLPISLNEAILHFAKISPTLTTTQSSNFNGSGSSTFAFLKKIEPRWDKAQQSQSSSGREIIVVPLKDSSLLQNNGGRADAKLVFSKVGTDSIDLSILVYVADSAYYQSVGGNLSLTNFTGMFIIFDILQFPQYGFNMKNGQLDSRIDSIGKKFSTGTDARSCCNWVTGWAIKCICNSFNDCHEWVVTSTLVCCDDDDGFGGGGGGGGNGGGNGGGGLYGGGNYAGGGGFGNGSGYGGGSNYYNYLTDINSVFSGAIPLSVFQANGGTLPEGMTVQSVQQFVEILPILQDLGFTASEIAWILNNHSKIPNIYNWLKPTAIDGDEDEASSSNLHQLVKFAKENYLTTAEFTFLGQNMAIFNQLFSLKQATNTHYKNIKYLIANQGYIGDFATFLNAHPNNAVAPQTLQNILLFLQNGNSFDNINLDNFPYPWAIDIPLNYAMLKAQHPDWGEAHLLAEATWQAMSGVTHTVLDVLGLVPGLGEPADLANGVVYTLEGDKLNAGLSFAAAVPFAGWFAIGAKAAFMAIAAGGKVINLSWTVVGAVITFGQRSQLRTVLNITDNLKEAHHIIPWEVGTHPLVQKAAQNKWHMNHANNGASLNKFRFDLLPDGVHANHPKYNSQVSNLLTTLETNLATQFGGINNVTEQIAQDKLILFQNNLAQFIAQNPTTKINDLNLPSSLLP